MKEIKTSFSRGDFKFPDFLVKATNHDPFLSIKSSPTSSRIEKIIQLLHCIRAKAPTEKTALFTQFTSLFKLLVPILEINGFNPLVYDGKMNIQERDEALYQFSKCNANSVLLCSLLCGSVGLNLVMANRVILIDPWWNPCVEDQAINRVHWIRQKRDVKNYKLTTPNTIEDKINQLQEEKRRLFHDAFKPTNTTESFSNLSSFDLEFLFKWESFYAIWSK